MATCPPDYQVVIVGAGLGGLCLGALLEKININFVILERATKVVPLGSSLSISPCIQALAIQLGIYDEIKKHSKEALECSVVYEDMTHIGAMDFRETNERTGYPSLIITRWKLHEIFASLVPKDKIIFGMKAVEFEQEEGDNGKVTVRCANGEQFHAQILVGADGAYSGVRQSLYKQLKKAGQLPEADGELPSASDVCLLGTTRPLDPQVWPELVDPYCQFQVMMSKTSPYSWGAFTLPGNLVAWAVSYRLDEKADRESESYRNTQWGPEGAAQMCKEVRDFPAPYGNGRTMGQLIDATDQNLISKVMLEDKFFTTWYHGRTVLLGDACHKMLPSAGMGANSAIMDATQLANAIFDIEEWTPEEITKAFSRYRAARYDFAEHACQVSQQFGKIFSGQTWTSKIIRKIALCYTPKFIERKIIDRGYTSRPQAVFLPPVADKGSVPGLPLWRSTKLSKSGQ